MIACNHSDVEEKGEGKSSGSHKIGKLFSVGVMVVVFELKFFSCGRNIILIY